MRCSAPVLLFLCRPTASSLGLQTMAVHAGEPHPRHQGAAVMPIYQSATFEYGGEAGEDVRYTRDNKNPSQTVCAGRYNEHVCISHVHGASTADEDASHNESCQ